MTDRTLNMPIEFDGGDLAATTIAVASLAQQAALPMELREGVYAIVDASGDTKIVETPGYQQKRERDWVRENSSTPHEIYAARNVRDVASFLLYLGRNTGDPEESTVEAFPAFGAGNLEVWADLERRSITAVLDGLDGWARHSVTLGLTISREWAEWATIDGKLLEQQELAEFVEDHLTTIGHPDGALLLDVCQSLQATVGATFKAANRLQSGERALVWEEQIEASAGRKGDVKIPEELTLVLRPFDGSDPVAVRASFRFRLRQGDLRLGVKLLEADRILDDAFDQITREIANALPVPVYRGRR